MARRTIPLLDVDRGLSTREATLSPADVPGSARDWSVRTRTLEGGLSDGVDVVEVATGPLRLVLLPTRGMGIWKAWWGELEIAWQAPARGPIHPKFVPLMEPGGLGWLRGFDELLCRCGLESNGAPEWDEHGQLVWPLHGRIANLPAHELAVTIDGDRGEVSVRGVVDETRLFGRKLRLVTMTTVRPDAPVIRVRDEVSNLSGEPGELELLYHVNFGRPIVEPGTRLAAPVRELSPRDSRAATRLRDPEDWARHGPGEPLRREEVFYAELHAGEDGRTRALLVAPEKARGASLVWDAAALPCFTLWKNPQPAADAYVTGLEPGTNYPNRRSFEKLRQRVVPLAAGESRRFELDLEIHPDRESVAKAEADVARITAGRTPLVHRDVLPRFAPL
jgi:hypothetical protein